MEQWAELGREHFVRGVSIRRWRGAEILSLKGDAYRRKDRDLARPPRARN